MEQETVVLLVHEDVSMLQHLQAILRQQKIQTWYASSCAEARGFLAGKQPLDVVFTGTAFHDGTWQDVLTMMRTIEPKSAVVLVTRLEETDLYLEAMQAGAFDYVVPPFSSREIFHIIKSVAALRTGVDDRNRAQATNA